MVKLRLQRYGSKGRPFYRIVVAKSLAGRNGAFVEIIGTYDPVRKIKLLDVKGDRALHWLRQGAVPTETVAYLLRKAGVLDVFLEERPNQRAKYKFLDKRVSPVTTATSVDLAASAIVEDVDHAPVTPEVADVPAPVGEEPAPLAEQPVAQEIAGSPAAEGEQPS